MGGRCLSDVGCRFDSESVELFVSLAKEESRTHLGRNEVGHPVQLLSFRSGYPKSSAKMDLLSRR